MGDSTGEARPPERPRPQGGGFLTQYKPEQGKTTRTGTFVGLGLLVVWGAYFVWDRLQVGARGVEDRAAQLRDAGDRAEGH